MSQRRSLHRSTTTNCEHPTTAHYPSRRTESVVVCSPPSLPKRSLLLCAHTVTAVDASTTALRLNQQRVANSKVTYLQADLFDWSPPRSYDFVFFGHWLSDIPPSRFDTFWDRVGTCIGDHGRVGFINEDERAADLEADRPSGHPEVARRTLSDGRSFDIINVFWEPDHLQTRLRSLRWNIRIERIAERFMVGRANANLGPRRPDEVARSAVFRAFRTRAWTSMWTKR